MIDPWDSKVESGENKSWMNLENEKGSMQQPIRSEM
jgi:hypothetical protein